MDQPRPLDALNRGRGKRVIIDLKNGKQLIGTLKSFDIHINSVLDDVEERKDGEVLRKMGTVFIRGDMVVTINVA